MLSDSALLVELILIFLVLCLLRVPIAFSLAGSALVLTLQLGADPQQIALQMYEGIGLFVLLAVPFFLLAGELLNSAGLTRDLVRTAGAVVGRVRGGLGQVNVFVSMVFAGISGSSTADTAAVGSVTIPAMKESGYSARFAAAVTAASSTMGNIIPPSLYMVIYGSLASVPIKDLFLAGIVPGILIGITQMVIVYFHAKRHPEVDADDSLKGATVGTVFRSVVAGGAGVVVVGGMVLGWFAATEAAAMAVAYCLLLFFVFRSPKPMSRLWRAGQATGQMYSAILLTIGAASAFGWVMAYLGGPEIIASMVLDVTTNPQLILLMVGAILLVLGTFMSEIATIVIFTPIFLSLQEIGGIDPVHMGVVVVMTLCLGLISPPYGVCLLISTQISRANFGAVCVSLAPFLGAFLLIVLAVIFVPDLALFIPGLVG